MNQSGHWATPLNCTCIGNCKFQRIWTKCIPPPCPSRSETGSMRFQWKPPTVGTTTRNDNGNMQGKSLLYSWIRGGRVTSTQIRTRPWAFGVGGCTLGRPNSSPPHVLRHPRIGTVKTAHRAGTALVLLTLFQIRNRETPIKKKRASGDNAA